MGQNKAKNRAKYVIHKDGCLRRVNLGAIFKINVSRETLTWFVLDKYVVSSNITWLYSGIRCIIYSKVGRKDNVVYFQ